MKKIELLVLIKWALLGLLIRLLVMPFAFHGSDIFWIYYSPFKAITEGFFDPYLYIQKAFPQCGTVYYPPIAFYTFLSNTILFKPFLHQLGNLVSVFEFWNFRMSANTVQYADILANFQLFRTLFIFKIPYLISDYMIGFLLLKIIGNSKKGLLAFKIWLFNPFVLHSCYLMGSFDILPALFIVLALWAAKFGRNYRAMSFLALGGGAKLAPLLLMPSFILILAERLKPRLKLLLGGIIGLTIIFLPFYLSSGLSFLGVAQRFVSYPRSLKLPFAAVCYLVFLSLLLIKRIRSIDRFELLLFYSVISLMLYNTIVILRVRFFVWVTPALIILAIKHKRFWLYNLIFLISIFGLKLCDNSRQFGLFASLHPEFFSGWPIVDSFINTIFDVHYIYQAMHRLFLITAVVVLSHILLIIRNKSLSNNLTLTPNE